MFYQCSIVMVNGGWRIKKGGKKVTPNIADVSGILIKAEKHILDMRAIYPKKLFFYKLCGIFIAGNVDGGLS